MSWIKPQDRLPSDEQAKRYIPVVVWSERAQKQMRSFASFNRFPDGSWRWHYIGSGDDLALLGDTVIAWFEIPEYVESAKPAKPTIRIFTWNPELVELVPMKKGFGDDNGYNEQENARQLAKFIAHRMPTNTVIEFIGRITASVDLKRQIKHAVERGLDNLAGGE